MAPIAPAAVEFQIHHVVPTFQISMAKKQFKKKMILFLFESASNNIGSHAKNIRNVKGDKGHAPKRNNPAIKPNKTGCKREEL